ncbi:MAG: alpha-mannosidase [Chloroflexi bacterium]|nr:alpha-mannosidase [Chloroflexota bacterium]
MKEKTLHMIGNAHIDPVWLWRWQEGFQEIKASFRSALDRLIEYPDFIFTASSAAYYEWIEENDPGMFAEICQRVKEGRWVIVGGWWVQPDCNIPSGESVARHALYSQRYFKEKFGIAATIGYCVDSFGHNGMLPQLLRKSGMNAYVFMRPMPHEKKLPARVFWWESDDGSRVLTLQLPFEYTSWGARLEKHLQLCAQEIQSPLDAMTCFYGVGNHGGGPTRENIDLIHHLQQDEGLPDLLFSSPNNFFKHITTHQFTLPVVHDDLQHHASGCYAAHSGIKRWNRLAENRLLVAEKFSALIENHPKRAVSEQSKSARKSKDKLAHAWKNVLFNQFHDIMAGTSIESAYDDARDAFGESTAIADRVLNHALQSLSWQIQIEPEDGMTPMVVFNPHAWQANANVELEIGNLQDNHILLDDDDCVVPMQRVQSLAMTSGRYRVSFIANVPPLGYRTYRLVVREARSNATHLQGASHLNAAQIENNRFRLEIDPQTGYIKQLFDKKFNVDVFSADAAKPVVIDDPSDTWSHDVLKFDQVIGAFTAQSVKLIEQGPVKLVLRVISTYGASRLTQDFTLYQDMDHIDVHVTVDWHEQFKMLKLRYPVNVHPARATYEIPYGHIERPANGDEEPFQSWLDVSGVSRDSGVPYGVSILNDGKYSADVKDSDIGLTVLRSPIYAHHSPAMPDPDKEYSFIDQGVRRFTYSILPHSDGWEQAQTPRRAAELNQHPVAFVETYHPHGTLPQCDSFVVVDADNVIVSVVKQAEDDDDSLIVRAYETNQTATRTAIRLLKWNRVIDAAFAPCEIKTWCVPRDLSKPITETNLVEW